MPLVMNWRFTVKKSSVLIAVVVFAAFVALAFFEAVFKDRSNPSNPPEWSDYYSMGVSLYDCACYEQSVTALKIAIAIDPFKEDTYLLCSKAYAALGKEEESKEILEYGLSELDSDMLRSALSEFQYQSDE